MNDDRSAEEPRPASVPELGAARHWLFVPAHDRRKLEKARSALLDGRCDRLILDWEDAVPLGDKAVARENTAALLADLEPVWRQKLVVRVHAADEPAFEQDLRALGGWLIGAVLLAKAECASQVKSCAALELPIVLLIESARGLLNCAEMLRADSWARGVAMGPLDFFADLRLEWEAASPALTAARQQLVFAARAAGKECILLGPYPELDDDSGLEADTTTGRRQGFTGRMAIHPRQLGLIERAFSPSASELDFARRVVTAWQERGREAALQLDGRFVDRPVVLWARQLLQRHTNGAHDETKRGDT